MYYTEPHDRASPGSLQLVSTLLSALGYSIVLHWVQEDAHQLCARQLTKRCWPIRFHTALFPCYPTYDCFAYCTEPQDGEDIQSLSNSHVTFEFSGTIIVTVRISGPQVLATSVVTDSSAANSAIISFELGDNTRGIHHGRVTLQRGSV